MDSVTGTYDHVQRLHKHAAPDAMSPLRWLRLGWKDMAAAPWLSALLGITFTGACFLAYIAAASMPLFSVAFLTLMVAVGPFLAAAGYSVARRRENGQSPSLLNSFRDVRSRVLSVGLFSLTCSMVVAAWVRLSGITFALYYGTMGASLADVGRVWTDGSYTPGMLVFLTLVSLVLLATLFAVGALSLPMIAERNCGVIEAMQASLRTLRENRLTMVAWALSIASLVGLAFLSSLVLMPVVFPLLAYATWHSYRQLSSA